MYSDAREQRPGHHNRSHTERHQPARQDADGPGPGAQKQRLQVTAGHHGVQERLREQRREDSVQYESQATGTIHTEFFFSS